MFHKNGMALVIPFFDALKDSPFAFLQLVKHFHLNLNN
ncbi:hypothetical protein CHK_1584 [Christensenella hongkongensis]|uniref:Uncharacterized protein n=1 Tax=Christensenella hongkongensis TaxID=270498 RepID=A0A0M2NL87_9FIRM|nr:hypothetical protein CHK_1584 [Christensenella hongkongensis]